MASARYIFIFHFSLLYIIRESQLPLPDIKHHRPGQRICIRSDLRYCQKWVDICHFGQDMYLLNQAVKPKRLIVWLCVGGKIGKISITFEDLSRNPVFFRPEMKPYLCFYGIHVYLFVKISNVYVISLFTKSH